LSPIASSSRLRDRIAVDGGPDWPAADPTSPYYCHGPTLISFSGGRTSAYMLWQVLCAHGGMLPHDVYVVFANTGKEREETLRFVYECGRRWGVHIWWLEWRPPGERVKAAPCPHRKRGRCDDCKAQQLVDAASKRFEVVGYNSADRTGVWFAELIRRKQYLPNQDMRYCTTTLKIETMKWFMVAQGLTHWFNIVGLRADEPARVLKQFSRNNSGKERWLSGCPLFVAGVTKRVVMAFWLGRNQNPRALVHPLPQGFDLGLLDHEGNCDLCFLKGRGKKAAVLRDAPWIAPWWIEQEQLSTARTMVRTSYAKRFDKREPIAALLSAVQNSPEMIDFSEGADTEVDCTGHTCMVDDGLQNADVDDTTVVWLRDYMAKLAADPRPHQPPKVLQPPAVRDLFDEMQMEDAA